MTTPSAPRHPASTRPASVSAACPTQQADLVARARELFPLLREHADEADLLGRLPDVVTTALRDAGFFGLQVPLALGGPGADFRTAFDVYTELGRGCGSSGWLAMVLSGGAYMASLLGGQARHEIWGTNPRAVICSRLPAAGTARVVEGGMVISGRWQPTSGVHHSTWAMVAVATDTEADLALAVLPTRSGSTRHTWDVTGLRATGSDTLLFDEAFVPGHRLLSLPRMVDGGYGEDHPDEPLCAAAVVPALTVTLVAPLLGMGLAALEHARDQLTRPSAAGATAPRAASTSVQRAMADAALLIDSARLLLLRALDDVDAAIARRTQPDPLVQARIHMDAAAAAGNLGQAVRSILTALGGAGFSATDPIQRIRRDMEIALSHSNITPDVNREAYGRALLGRTGAQAS